MFGETFRRLQFGYINRNLNMRYIHLISRNFPYAILIYWICEKNEYWADHSYSILIWLSIVLLVLREVPKFLRYFFTGSLILIHISLEKINHKKIELTKTSLTFDDISTSIQNIDGLLQAINAPSYVKNHISLIILFFVVPITLFIAKPCIQSVKNINNNSLLRSFILLVLTISSAILISIRQADVIDYKYSDTERRNQELSIALSHQIGIVPFIFYTYHRGRGGLVSELYDYDLGLIDSVTAHSDDEEKADGRNEVFYDSMTKPHNLLPNVFFILLESTVNFHNLSSLSGEINKLFIPDTDTALLTHLRVNPVGGGTWMTEFETINGMDTRLFGYHGKYPHSLLSPSIKRSFVTYLHEKGYKTTAFYPVNGKFFDAEKAYKNYGFDKFVDDDNGLILEKDWAKFSDVDLINQITKLIDHDSHPNYIYALTLENHSPHPCVHYNSDAQLAWRFEKTQNFTINCAMNEYQVRLKSTSQAVDQIKKYLSEVQTRTGRPFILVVFGDHVPATFVENQYEDLIPEVKLHQSFIHIYSSLKGKFKCCDQAIPAYLVPTLVSAMLESEKSKLYLPENLDFYHQCGLDSVGNVVSLSQPQEPGCHSAFKHALAAYRQHSLRSSR